MTLKRATGRSADFGGSLTRTELRFFTLRLRGCQQSLSANDDDAGQSRQTQGQGAGSGMIDAYWT